MKKNKLSIIAWVFIIFACVAGAGLAAYFSWLAIPVAIGILALLSALVLVFDKPWLGVAIVAFFLPFERIGGFDLVGQTTIRLSQVFALVTIVSWILYYLLIRRYRVRHLAVTWPLLAYLVVAAISITAAVNTGRAITVFLFTAFVIVFALVIPQVLRTTRQTRWVILALLLSSVLVSIFGLYQFAGDVVGLPEALTGLREHYTSSVFGFPRVHSTALEPLYFANYLLIPIAVAFLLWLFRARLIPSSATGRWVNFFNSRAFPFLVFLLGSLALILTLSRGGYLGLIATAVALLVFGWRKIFTGKNITIIVSAVLVVALGAVIVISFSGRFALDDFLDQATEFEGGAGVDERFGTYDEAEKLFAAHPLLGIGVGNFGPEVATYPHRMPEGGWLIVNNEPLEILAETGILGLAAILGAVIITFWQGFATYRNLNLITDEQKRYFLKAVTGGLLAAFVGIIVQYQTFSTLYIIHIWFVFGLLAALNYIAKDSLTKKDEV